ncbi:MAG: hypothetical protein ACXVGB_07110 [Mycobacteriaceae bacterium]
MVSFRPPAAGRGTQIQMHRPAIEHARTYAMALAQAGRAKDKLRAAASVTGARSLLATLRAFPVMHAHFSDSPAGRELHSWFADSPWVLPVNRLGVAVLALPEDYADYVRGRHRQALRTNVRRSALAGVTCAEVTEPTERARCIVHIVNAGGDDPNRLLTNPTRHGLRRHFAVAYDATGDPVALSETILDVAWAGLGVFLTAMTGQHSRDARYHLHEHLIRHLISSGVEHLAVGGSVLLTPAGTRYFQERTGFTPVRLQPRILPRGHRRHTPP